MAIATGLSAILVALLFARTSSVSYSVARMQPLRTYLLIYAVMILLIGGFVGQHLLKRLAWRWAVLFLVLGGCFLFVQLRTFPNSAHLEILQGEPGNGWESGFLWIREHTARDAVFALDANYITSASEDAQNFGAIAERSALPDYSKDGGIAAIAPGLTGEWIYGETAQQHLNDETDAERAARLRFAAVEWIVLSRTAKTKAPCVYTNESIKSAARPGAVTR